MKRMFRYVVWIAGLAFIVNGCTSNKSNPTAPAPTFSVTGLGGARTDSVTIRVTWNAVGGADSIYVKRGWGSGTPTDTVARLSGAATIYTDAGVRSDSSYSYRVTARHDTATTVSSVITVARYSTVTVIHYNVSVRPILNACTQCHSSAGGSSGGWTVDGLTAAVNARTVGSYRGLGGVIVVPGNAAGSEMYQHIIPTSNDPMPQGGPPLATSQITTIHDWIQQGANP